VLLWPENAAIVWLLIELEVICTLLLAQPVVLSKEPLTLPLVSREEKTLSNRLFEVARSPAHNVILVLKGVETEARPGVSWEVYVEPVGTTQDAQSPYLVGVFSLFDRGIMSEGQQNREPAEFLFVLDKAISAAGKRDLQVRFVPTSGVVVEGQPQTAEVRSNVTIGDISLAIEAARQQ
jgi:hypothetical protein